MMTLKTFSNHSITHRQDKKFLLILLGLNILTFAATVFVYSITNTTLEREKLKIFNQDAEKIQQLVEERMLAHVNTLRSLQALWNSHNRTITDQEFSLFINSLNVFYDFPGVASIHYIKRLNNQLISTYVEPKKEQTNNLGFDHAVNPARKQFFDLARDTGEILYSLPFSLATANQPGFFLIAPLYQNSSPPKSLIERQNQSTGFIVMIFWEKELFKSIFGRQNPLPDIDFAIYHNYHERQPGQEKLLFDSDPEFDPFTQPKILQTKKYITIGNTPWTIFVTAKPSFSLKSTEEKLPLFVLTSGLVFSGGLGITIIYFYRKHLTTWH